MDRDDLPSSPGALFELEDITEQPGTYFNPRTEITLVVDDSGLIDQSILPEPDETADWVRISEEPAIDDQFRDELLGQFETTVRTGDAVTDPEMLDPDGDLEKSDGGDLDGFGPGPDPEV